MFLGILDMSCSLWNCVVQRVAVLHLEERCERAIEWALNIDPSIKHLVMQIKTVHFVFSPFKRVDLLTISYFTPLPALVRWSREALHQISMLGVVLIKL